MNVTIMLRTFVCALTAALVQRFFAGGFEGEPWGRLGHEGYPLEFGHMPDLQYRVWDLPVIAMVAALCGILGAVWNFINIRLARWRKRRIGQTGLRRWTEAMLAGAVVATLNYWAPVLVYDSAAEGLSPETRPSVLSWNSQAHAIELLFTSEHRFDSVALLVLLVTHFLTGCWAFGLGMPCGIFVPTLTSGAALGRLIGQGLYTIGYIDQTKDIGAYALIGAGGLLAGVARITISLSVILLEAVQNQTFALPLFMTTLVAKQAGNHFNEGIYDMLIKLRGIPLMELGVEKGSIHRKAQEVMATELVTLSPVEEAGKLLAKLEGCAHNAFPVVDSSGLFLGLARRKMLERVLSSTTFPNDDGLLQLPSGPLASPAPKMSSGGISRRPCSLDVVREALGEEDLRRRVDVRPFMNDACYTVLEHTSLLRCHELFRTMGLRHLPVVDRSGVIRGILTRKDLILAEDFLHVAGEHHKRKAALAGTGTESTAPAWPTRNKDNDPASPHLLAE
jgi:chloride channel 7